MKFTKEQIRLAETILLDNGIEPGEEKEVLQAIGYALLNEELYPEDEKYRGNPYNKENEGRFIPDTEGKEVKTRAKHFTTDKNVLAAFAFANCQMILENAIVMPDSYIKENYGSDRRMCRVAEKYFDFGMKILNSDIDCTVAEISLTRTDDEE